MSDIIRSYRPGHEWTVNELEAYNIVVEGQSDVEFFGEAVDDVELQGVPMGILTYNESDQPSYEFFTYMDMANQIIESEESAVDDFAVFILGLMGYKGDGRVIRTRKDIPLLMCGHQTHAKTDVCVMNRERILALIQENKSHISRSDPEPQVIAEAIASFQYNNKLRTRDLNTQELTSCLFPCITMAGTRPVFYKICVTSHLDRAIRFGQRPKHQTRVARFDPLLASHSRTIGMLDLDNRVRVLKSFQLFKQYVLSPPQ